MEFSQFNITNAEGKSNCVVRSLCKLLNDEYDNVYDELCKIQKDLKCEAYNDVEVFETFMNNHNINKIEYGKDIKIKDLKLEKGSYAIFCWDRNQYYHMIAIIDDIIYDKDDKSLGFYTISIYKI